MPDYRLYFVGHDGHFASVEPLVCDDDEAAIETAATYIDGQAMELWDRGRKIRDFPKS